MDYNTFINEFPVKLNEQQKNAIKAVEGPVLLLAVPGSGKTTVLVARLGYMIHCCNIKPQNILTLTYTVAATNDMRERFSSFFGSELGDRMNFRTINSICAGIINYYGTKIGKKPFELLNDDKQIMSLISSIYQKIENAFPTESELKGIRTQITYIKNMMLNDEKIAELGEATGVHLLEIYKAYCSQLRKNRLMDFDDQMIYAYNMLRSNKELLTHFQNLYSYICVDEAQDTSRIQHEIIKLLAAGNENLFMVGDEDQSIYGFRAAYPEGLLSFEKEHPKARVLFMEENFRSNANIVEAADVFIQQNTLRHKKRMRATRKRGSEIKEISIASRKAQYSYLLKVAKDCGSQTAVLYRDNESAIPLVDLLERQNIPYRIRNGEPSFFSHRVVLDIQNILKFSYNPYDTALFEQIYYKLSTYLTKQMAQSLCEIANFKDITIFEALDYVDSIKPHNKTSIRALQTHFKNMRDEIPSKAIYRIVNFMGYGAYLERASLGEGKIYFLETIAAKELSIEGFLKRLEELKDIIQNKKNDYDCLFILSTIHSSKGLEYDNVYLIDAVDGVFPENIPSRFKHISREELQNYEEERRLFYVGATRAKENLNIFTIPNNSTFYSQLLPRKEKAKTKCDIAYNEFLDKLALGTAVYHKKFGEGLIVGINDTNMTIKFGKDIRKLNIAIVFSNNLLRIL